MQGSYRKRLQQRTWHILWGRIEVAAAVLGLLVILSRPVMDYLLKLWGGLPWWVGVLILGGLLLYAFVRASYEEYREVERKRAELEEELRQREQLSKDLQAKNEELIAAGPALSDLDWQNQPMNAVFRRVYRNQGVELDGRSFANCTFENVTFVYKGEKPFLMTDPTFKGANHIDARNTRIRILVQLLLVLNAIRPDVQIFEDAEE